MNFEIFMGLLGIPLIIIFTAVFLYIYLGRKDKAEEITIQKDKGVSQ
jgi:hypothetical protein